MFFTKTTKEDEFTTHLQEFRNCLAEANKLLDLQGQFAKACKQLDEAGTTFDAKRASLIAVKANKMNQLKVGISQEALDRYSRLLKEWLENYHKIAAPYQTCLDSMNALLTAFSEKLFDTSYPNAEAIQALKKNIDTTKDEVERYGYAEMAKDLEKVLEVCKANTVAIAEQRLPGLSR